MFVNSFYALSCVLYVGTWRKLACMVCIQYWLKFDVLVITGPRTLDDTLN